MKFQAIDLVWETHRDAIEEELKTLLEVKELDNWDPRIFQQCNAAAKLVLEKMSEEERTELVMALETRRASGNPELVQQL